MMIKDVAKGRKRRIQRIREVALSAILCTIFATTGFIGLIPATTVHAAGTGKKLQIGSGGLSDYANSIQAAKIYFRGYSNGEWAVIGYNGTGVGRSANQDAVTVILANSIVMSEFNQSGEGNAYDNSRLRTQIGQVADTFSTVEQAAIKERVLSECTTHPGTGHGQNNPYCDGIAKDDYSLMVKDKLWPLSAYEVGTEGLNGDFGITGIHWLRSPASDSNKAIIGSGGYVEVEGLQISANEIVHPAMNVKLESIVFTSFAEDGKISGPIGPDALSAPTDVTSPIYYCKLTLLDSSRNFTAQRTGSGNVDAGDTVSVSYTNASTGANEYVSAILLDLTGNLLYYGKIVDNTSGTATANGTADITIPAGLPDGNYTIKVFSEQCNANYYTDYASSFSTISIAIGDAPVEPAETPGPGTPEKPTVLDQKDWLDVLNEIIDNAIKTGETQTVYIKGVTGLPITIMRKLKANPQITLNLNYSYEGVEYNALVPGKTVVVDDTIPWYGPLYLHKYYGF